MLGRGEREDITRKLTIKPWFQPNKGFTLIELILTLAISSIVMVSIYSLLEFSTNVFSQGDIKDQLLLNGRYAIEYIKDDIRRADKIISSDKFSGLNLKYPSNIGFVILLIDETTIPMQYTYITYYQNRDKIVRVASTRVNETYPNYSYFSGHNNLCQYAGSIGETRFEPSEKMIYLSFIFNHENGEELKLNSDIYIRSPIDY